MQPARILLIEDDRWLSDSYREVLDQYSVETAIDAHDAMELIDSNDYNLVIADVMLEHGLVIDLLHELQSYEDTTNLPVILCTTLARKISLSDLTAYGVVEILDKTTLTPKLLREVVESYLL